MKKVLFVISIIIVIQIENLYSQTLQVTLSPDKSKVDRNAKEGKATIIFDSNIEDLGIVCTDENPEEPIVKVTDNLWYIHVNVKKDIEFDGICYRNFLLKSSSSAEYYLTTEPISPKQVLYYTVSLPNELEPKLLEEKSRRIASKAMDLLGQGDSYLARLLALEALPPNMPYTSEAESALRLVNMSNNAHFIRHTNRVNSIAVSSDDCYLVSGADDHKVIIWDAKNANKLKELNNFNDDIVSIQFCNDDQYLLTASDTEIYLFDAVKGTIIHSYKNGHSAEITKAILGPHSTIISGDWNGDVVIWDMKSEKILHKFNAHEKGHLGLAVSNDSRFLLTYSNAQQYPMKIWNIGTYSVIKRFSLEEKCSVDKAIFSPDSKLLLATLGVGKMKLYSTSHWEKLEEIKIDLLGCESASFSPDNKKIALGSTYGKDITILDAATFDTISVYHCEDKVRDCIFSHDSRMLLACDNSKKNLFSGSQLSIPIRNVVKNR